MIFCSVECKWGRNSKNMIRKHESKKSNRKAMNRNWSNQKENTALKTKTGKSKYYKWTKYNENKLLTERAAISQKVATQQPKLN